MEVQMEAIISSRSLVATKGSPFLHAMRNFTNQIAYLPDIKVRFVRVPVLNGCCRLLGLRLPGSEIQCHIDNTAQTGLHRVGLRRVIPESFNIPT